VVVINSSRKILIASFFIASFIGFQNCSVDLQSTTPGAQSVGCSPTTQQLADFQPIMTGILQQTGNVGAEQGCGNCHMPGASGPTSGSGAGSFRIISGSTADVALANFCSATSRLQVIAVHPTQSSHAQVYTTSDLTQLSAWVATF
jgi:hypothetical protein